MRDMYLGSMSVGLGAVGSFVRGGHLLRSAASGSSFYQTDGLIMVERSVIALA